MKGDVVPDAHRIARFCRPKQVERDEILGAAFLPRVGEPYLSVNWVEFLDLGTEQAELQELRTLYGRKFQVGAGARIAILNAGHLRSWVRESSPDRRDLEVLHEPLDAPEQDLSHAGVFNVRHDDELIAELMRQAVSDSHPARE